jgi:hypothetical protein
VSLRWIRRFGGALLLAILCGGASRLQPEPDRGQPRAARTCYVTGGGDLQVCHAAASESIFLATDRWQVAYNTQIIALGKGRYATVLHGEAKDLARHLQETHRPRPGDSIKSGMVDATSDPQAAYAAPANLDFRIWGNLNNPRSMLYDRFDPSNPLDRGLSGGGNPMVVRGSPQAHDPFFYVFFLGVSSDGLRGTLWRDVLLQARTRDFLHFDVLQQDERGRSDWVAFAGDSAMPAVVTDVAGHPIVSNRGSPVNVTTAGHGHRPAVTTDGLIGSVVLVNGVYHYFYTDQDPADPARRHLYVRTARDLSANGAWSEPQVLMDTPPGILIRVAKARGMDRWAVFYNCLRSVDPRVADIGLQYTANLALTGPGSIQSLSLFDGAPYTGLSRHALGLRGSDRTADDDGFLKIQQFYMTDPDGNLTVPPERAAGTLGGLLTWTEMPSDFNIFGAPVYLGAWDVTPTHR